MTFQMFTVNLRNIWGDLQQDTKQNRKKRSLWLNIRFAESNQKINMVEHLDDLEHKVCLLNKQLMELHKLIV